MHEIIIVVMYFSGYCFLCFVFFQAEDGIRDLVRSRGLGDVYKRQIWYRLFAYKDALKYLKLNEQIDYYSSVNFIHVGDCLLYTSDAADERSSVDLGGRRIIKKKNKMNIRRDTSHKKKSTNKV